MSWFKYDCKFCAETCSIDIFGYHLMENHFDHLSGSIQIKDDRIRLLCVTKEDEDMFMCTACGFAVKTQVTFDKHLRTMGEEHRKRHLENIRTMKGSTFRGEDLKYISELELEEDDEEEEVVARKASIRKRSRSSTSDDEEPEAKRPRYALPLGDRFNKTYSDLLQIYNELLVENRRLTKENEDLTRSRENAIKLLSKS